MLLEYGFNSSDDSYFFSLDISWRIVLERKMYVFFIFKLDMDFQNVVDNILEVKDI